MAALVDTNVLVYRFDPRFPKKQRIATDLLRKGLADDTLRLPHQAILESLGRSIDQTPGIAKAQSGQ